MGINQTSKATGCKPELQGIYPGLKCEHNGLEHECNDEVMKRLYEANDCLNKIKEGCSTTKKLSKMVEKRKEIEGILARIDDYEKDGYPIYNAVYLGQMKKAIGFLYVKLSETCNQELFLKIVDSMISASKLKHPDKKTMKDYNDDWKDFEKNYSAAQTHARYFKGEKLYAIKLLAISGVSLPLIKQLVPYKPPVMKGK